MDNSHLIKKNPSRIVKYPKIKKQTSFPITSAIINKRSRRPLRIRRRSGPITNRIIILDPSNLLLLTLLLGLLLLSRVILVLGVVLTLVFLILGVVFLLRLVVLLLVLSVVLVGLLLGLLVQLLLGLLMGNRLLLLVMYWLLLRRWGMVLVRRRLVVVLGWQVRWWHVWRQHFGGIVVDLLVIVVRG